MLRNFSSNLVLPIVLAGGLFLSIAQDNAYAQGVADDAAKQAEQIERDRAADERQRLLEKNRLDNLPPDGTNVSPPQEDVAASDGDCVHVNVVSVTGTTLLRAREIRKITAPFEDRCLGHSDLNGILEQLTFLYVEKGFITSRAFLPEQ
ncbi:MAG: hypothetical protein OXE98_07715, partial [Hyphomicrobiales bacterium]|nr:hypothetical protein [Hyphomicrobiales bacterium]